LRQLAYPNVHTIILCFSVVRPETLWALRERWLTELSQCVLLNPAAALTASRIGCFKDGGVSSGPAAGLSPPRPSGVPQASPLHSSLSASLHLPAAAPSGHTRSTSGPRVLHSRSKHRPRSSFTPRLGPAFILVGCACDLRNDIKRLLDLSKRNEKPVDEHVAQRLAMELGAEAYIECSALTQKQLKKVFDLAIWYGLRVKEAGGPVPLAATMPGPAAENSDDSSLLEDQSTRSQPALTHRQRVLPLKAVTPSPVASHRLVNSSSSAAPRRHHSFVDHRIKRTDSPNPSEEYSHRSVWKRLWCIS
uniref:Rho-related GTP-binding protein RhoU n=1 Tax=Schistocephalus solidus TaxID=70667 RepID=A0A183TPY1_SCHSO